MFAFAYQLERSGPMELVGGLCCFIPFGLLAIAANVFWIWTLIDCLMNEPSEGNDKLVWALVIVLTNVLGGLLYFFIRRPVRKRDVGR